MVDQAERNDSAETLSFHVEGEEEGYLRNRLPSDLLRLVVALVAGLLGFLLASVLDNISVGITIEVIDAFDGLPTAMVVTTILAVQLVAWILPLLVVGLLLVWRRYRRLALVLLASAVAIGIAWGIQSELTARFAPPELAVEPPSWVCENIAASTDQGVRADDPGSVGDLVTDPDEAIRQVFGSHACVPGDGFPSIVYLAGLAAAFSTLTPWLNRRWRRTGWIVLLAFLIVRLIDGLLVPVDALLILALSYAIGAGVLLAFGSPDRRPKGYDIGKALVHHGFDVVSVSPAEAGATSTKLYSVQTADGHAIFAKVRSAEERAAEILFRLYRMARLKGFGDERPFASLRREVEHEAGMSLAASAAGVATPQMLRVADVTPSAMLIAYDEIDGSTLDEVDTETITDEVLRSTWAQVATLHSARMSHRHLSPANILLTSDGQPWLIDFGFAEISASDGDLNGDVAQLMATLTLVVGPQRTVAAAVDQLGAEAVAAAAPRLQPTALSTTTRNAFKKRKGLLKELHREVQEATGLEEFELEKLERVNSRTVFMLLMLALAFYVLIPQLAEVDFGEVIGADWQWFPLVLFFSLMTYVGAAVALMGAMPERLRFFPTILAQIAASFFNRIAPAKVGGIAANIRYLQKSGIEPAVAIAGVGLNNVAGVVVHVLLLTIFVTTAGRSATDVFSLPSGQTVLVVLAVVLAAAGAVMLLPWGRKLWLRRVWPILRKSVSGVTAVAVSPLKMLALFGGAFVITMSYVFALWYSIAAFGGGIGFVAVTAVYLAGSALAQVAPTPGGIGAAEAALIAGLTTFGLDPGVAVPAVFLFRIGTFWAPILPGYLAFKRLERLGAL
ncbi:MAG: lysylphosphatidylglycerol synthase transmembrane domain-containing protein [Acidimicrobiia bacterium]|nr:lysylphosphatidylglycerol synthase transmembrane domain-containing protein [Acidimicrobiia bacterium]